MSYISIDSSLFFKSSNQNDPRYGHFFRSGEGQNLKKSLIVIGYGDDEGTQLNGGRLGSKEAPDKIRQYFYKTTPYDTRQQLEKKNNFLFDLGNLKIDGDLKSRHEKAKTTAYHLFKDQNRLLTLGGSHDYAYADGAAFLQAFASKKTKPLIVNFDAHSDCRPTDKGLNSGTPFYRLLSEFGGQFDFIEVGLQKLCNSKTYVDWARSKKAQLFFNDENVKAMSALKKALSKKRPVWVSIDLDAFGSIWAVGTSNNWPFGMTLEQFQPFYNLLLSKDVKGLGLYEVVPILDSSDVTVKLAASLAHSFTESIYDQLG